MINILIIIYITETNDLKCNKNILFFRWVKTTEFGKKIMFIISNFNFFIFLLNKLLQKKVKQFTIMFIVFLNAKFNKVLNSSKVFLNF